MRGLKKSLFTGMLIFFVFGFVHAQDNCKNALYEANVLYESGKIVEAIDRLLPCLAKKMPGDERFESYRFIAIAYQNLKDIDKSKVYIEKMLHEKPDYQKLPNNDPPEFTRLVDQFRISPLFEYSLGAGISFLSPKSIQSYSMFEVPQEYPVSPGYSLSLSGNYWVSEAFQLRAGLGLNGTTFRHNFIGEDGWGKYYSENLRWWSFSLSPRYFLPLGKKLKTFAGIRAGTGYISRSYISVKTDNVKDNSTEYATRDGLADKSKVQPAIGLLAGFCFPMQRGAMELEFSFDWYVNSLTNPDQRYANTEFIFLAQYTADDLKMRIFQISLNYSLPGYYRINHISPK